MEQNIQGQPGHPINHEKLFRNEQVLCEMLAERLVLVQILMKTAQNQALFIEEKDNEILSLKQQLNQLKQDNPKTEDDKNA